MSYESFRRLFVVALGNHEPDGGSISVPTFRMYDPRGNWFREGYGVEPDIEVIEDPSQLANGVDPQLARAIKEVQDRIAKAPKPPTRPAPEVRIPKRVP